MKSKNIMVVIEAAHPHFEAIKNKFLTRTMDEAINSYETYDIVVDLTILRTDRKIVFLKELARTTKAIIISDLTCAFQDKVFHYIPQVKASVSSFFYSPTSTIEFFIRSNIESNLEISLKNIITDFFKEIELHTYQAQTLEITFTLPRVVSQIINEAFFALEENLASKKDIDSSMIHGVNYPMGPIAWGIKSGLSNIVSILEELYLTTHDQRYRPSLALKKECLL
jgi:hypothetical protein